MRPDVARIASASAYAIAIVYILVALNAFLRPTAQSVEETIRFLIETPIHHYIREAGFSLIALFFIPVIAALRDLLEDAGAGMMRWATTVGYIGCAGALMTNLRMLTLAPINAQIYVQGDEVAKAIILNSWAGNYLDQAYWFQFGAVGFWLFVASTVALREGETFSRGWGFLGVAGALIHFLIVLSELAFPAIQGLAALLGGLIVAPIWAVWTGRRLKSLSESVSGRGAHRQAV